MVEYPGFVRDDRRALRTMGGEETIAKERSRGRRFLEPWRTSSGYHPLADFQWVPSLHAPHTPARHHAASSSHSHSHSHSHFHSSPAPTGAFPHASVLVCRLKSRLRSSSAPTAASPFSPLAPLLFTRKDNPPDKLLRAFDINRDAAKPGLYPPAPAPAAAAASAPSIAPAFAAAAVPTTVPAAASAAASAPAAAAAAAPAAGGKPGAGEKRGGREGAGAAGGTAGAGGAAGAKEGQQANLILFSGLDCISSARLPFCPLFSPRPGPLLAPSLPPPCPLLAPSLPPPCPLLVPSLPPACAPLPRIPSPLPPTCHAYSHPLQLLPLLQCNHTTWSSLSSRPAPVPYSTHPSLSPTCPSPVPRSPSSPFPLPLFKHQELRGWPREREAVRESSEEGAYVRMLRPLFQERPVWSRNSLKHLLQTRHRLLLPINDGSMKRALLRFAYYFCNGPFRMQWIRNGYDPRTNPDNRKCAPSRPRPPAALPSLPHWIHLRECTGPGATGATHRGP
ncbi:unnamed protein product [Closterium sp. NIES-65]|nr:unnamed protein product [Closterium sp. NIES-65]